MFVLKIFKYLHCENIVDVHEDEDNEAEASLEETARRSGLLGAIGG